MVPIRSLFVLTVSFILFFASSLPGTWITQTTPLLPKKDYSVAICAYNNTISLLGGYIYPKALVEFEIKTTTMINISQQILPTNAYGWSQFYVQFEQNCMWIVPNYKNIAVYNLETKNVSQITAAFGTKVGDEGCLAFSDPLLFVIGGNNDGTLNTLQIYNMSSEEWFYGPTMNTKRKEFPCIVHPIYNALYAIGGHDGAAPLVKIEKIIIDNIRNNEWIYIQDLNVTRLGSRAVITNNLILVIGGWDGISPNEGSYLSEIIAINCSNDQLFSAGNLKYGTVYPGVILVNEIFGGVYVFGGGIMHGNVKTWQYSRLLLPTTKNPTTSNPTTYKPTTSLPTTSNIPSVIPTQSMEEKEITQPNITDYEPRSGGQPKNVSLTVIIGIISGFVALVFFCFIICLIIQRRKIKSLRVKQVELNANGFVSQSIAMEKLPSYNGEELYELQREGANDETKPGNASINDAVIEQINKTHRNALIDGFIVQQINETELGNASIDDAVIEQINETHTKEEEQETDKNTAGIN